MQDDLADSTLATGEESIGPATLGRLGLAALDLVAEAVTTRLLTLAPEDPAGGEVRFRSFQDSEQSAGARR